MQTVKQGKFHTKKFSKQTEFAFKPFRPKTRPVNKLRMNMKALLNPRFNKKKVISVQDSSSDDEERNKSTELELSLHQVFDNINRSLRQIPDLAPKSCIYNSSHIEDDNPSKLPKAEVGKIPERQAECNEKFLTEQDREKVANLNKRKAIDEDT